MIKDDIAELIANCAGDAVITERHYAFAVAILDLPHPDLTCTIGMVLKKAPLLVRRINAQDKMLLAYRTGSSKIAEKVFDEMKATENALFYSGGTRIEVKK